MQVITQQLPCILVTVLIYYHHHLDMFNVVKIMSIIARSKVFNKPPGQCSLAILLWVDAMSTGNSHGHHLGGNNNYVQRQALLAGLLV